MTKLVTVIVIEAIGDIGTDTIHGLIWYFTGTDNILMVNKYV